LVPIGADPTPGETAALAAALEGYAKRSSPDDFSSLTGFLEAYPRSPWNAALLTALGLEYYRAGHYSKTLDVWSQAWQLARAATDLKGKAMADRAVGELAYMYARLGWMTELDALLKSVEGRVFRGPATERITGAREGLSYMQTRPEIAFLCGPLALDSIKLFVDPKNPGTELIHTSTSTQEGLSLQRVAELSQQVGLDFQMAFREKGATFVVPSVVHLKVDHYAAIVRQEGDRYLLQDPTFGNNVWVTSAALEGEASGYFLIPPGELARGWRAVGVQEGEQVWGKGLVAVGNDSNALGPCDPQTPGGNACPKEEPKEEDCCKGVAVPRVHLMPVSLNISDEPVGYSPPVGPAVPFTVRYNQREAGQPSTGFTYSNLGSKWTFDWLSYITDNPLSPSADVTYYIMGGGTRTFTGFDSSSQTYAFQQYDQTKLKRTSPDTYEMLSGDGTRKVFSQSDGTLGTSRKVFLTQLIDPFGNAVSLTYDANLRVVAITDAIGQVTTVSYEHPTDIFKITKVTDPFGRSASFDYDASNRLIKITDVIGITSQFTYDAGDFIKTLTTPYGVTSFTKSESGTTRSLETVYPDGTRDRVEFNQSTHLGIPESDPPQSVPKGMATGNVGLAFRNTYYWDKMACAYAYGDYTKARIYHWLRTPTHLAAGILESVKEPLEGRVWYDYAGQSSGPNFEALVGSSNKPIHVGRVLDDGSTQLYTYEYNGFGNVTKMIDPVGRTFSHTYAENGIDLLEVRQTRASQNQLLSEVSYDARHLPLTFKDAADQTTTYTYNARGQILTETNAKNETTTFGYDANCYLTSIDEPLPGSGNATTLTYDSVGRVRTKTDEGGYTLTFDYDDLDRVTKVTFPDATFVEAIYARLDPTLIRDRAGRETAFEYNAVRQMTKRTDPPNTVTLFQWCKCGDLRSVTDSMGRTTTWRHDVQGRVKYKEYADGSRVTLLYENTTGRLRQRIDEKLQVTQYNYNPDDTISQISYTNAAVTTPPVTFAYDANYNRLSSMTDGTGTTRYGYIPITPTSSLGAGQLASVDGPLPNDTVTFDYDELGRRVSTAINGVASSVTFDVAGRIATTSNALGVFDYTYDGASPRVVSQSYPNGQTAEFSYAGSLQDHHLQKITHKLGPTPISEFVYDRDVPTGQITS
jgi:YD repeat-containing protein